MPRLPLLWLLVALGSPTAYAAVYRWVDAQGYPHYSDRPAPVTEELRPPPPSAAPAPAPVPRPPPQEPTTPLLGPYRAFQILSPRSGETLRRSDGQLFLALSLDPPLRDGQRLQLTVDGTQRPVEKSATTFTIDGLAFGDHAVQARIVDANGAVVARTPRVPFQLLKPIPPGVLQ